MESTFQKLLQTSSLFIDILEHLSLIYVSYLSNDYSEKQWKLIAKFYYSMLACSPRNPQLSQTNPHPQADYLLDCSLTYSHTPCDSLRIIPSFLIIQIPNTNSQINAKLIEPRLFKKRTIRSSSQVSRYKDVKAVEPKELHFRHVSKSEIVPGSQKQMVKFRRLKTEVNRDRTVIRKRMPTTFQKSPKSQQLTKSKDSQKPSNLSQIQLSQFLNIQSQHIKCLHNRKRRQFSYLRKHLK